MTTDAVFVLHLRQTAAVVPPPPSRADRVHHTGFSTVEKKQHKAFSHMLVPADMLMCCTTGTDNTAGAQMSLKQEPVAFPQR